MPIAMPVHVINLKCRADRKAAVAEQLRQHQIVNHQFVEAVDGTSLDVDGMHDKDIVDFKCRRLTRGEYGCYLSHLGVYHDILSRPEEIHLILEDDIYFVKNFSRKFGKLVTAAQGVNWDVFYIGLNNENMESKQGGLISPKTAGIYRPRNQVWGTHAYLIKKKTVENIIDRLLPIALPIDVTLMSLPIDRIAVRSTIVKTHQCDSDTKAIR